MNSMASRIRSTRERIIQVLCYEAGGLLVMAPMFSIAAGEGMTESYVLMAALSCGAMIWAGVFNTVYDLIEHRVTGRFASDRPHHWRLTHALTFEATQVIISCPLIYLLTNMSWLEALVADFALTGAYAAYGYVFHWAFDLLRPVAVAAQVPASKPMPTATHHSAISSIPGSEYGFRSPDLDKRAPRTHATAPREPWPARASARKIAR